MKVKRLCLLLCVSAISVIALCGGAVRAWAAPAATTTSLAMTSGDNAVTTVNSGSVVTLTATVMAGDTPVTVGQVNFCDATATICTDIHLLGTAQLTRVGTASMKFRPGVRSHSYKAIFAGMPNGKSDYSGSTSSTVTLTVTGAISTTTSIAASGSVGNYSLTATVTGSGSTASPTGSVSFLDTNDGNALLGTAVLGKGTDAVSWTGSTRQFQTNWGFTSIATGDFNGDGVTDLAVTNIGDYFNYGDGTVTVLLGNGDGTFTPAAESPAAGVEPISLAVGDFNGDGIPDLAVVNYSGDLSRGTVTVLLGNGDGTFAAKSSPATGAGPTSIAVGDFNRDGIPDLAVVSEKGTVSILLGNGDGTFRAQLSPATGVDPQFVAVGDFNGDGIPDLAVVNSCGADATCKSPGTVSILLGNGDGTFTPAASPTVGYIPQSIALADFNSDGILDLAVENNCGADVTCKSPGTVSILLGNGDGTFTATTSLTVGDLPQSIVVGDFNGDGNTDLAVTNTTSGTVSILLGNGNGTFAAASSQAAEVDPHSITAGNFDASGMTDLAVVPWYTVGSNTVGNWVTVLLSHLTQTATATATGVSPVGTGTHMIEASYPGDNSYSASTSATTGLTAITPPSFTVSGTAVTVSPGATTGNRSTITVTPAGGFTGSVALTAAITTGPSGGIQPTLSFGSTTPASITGTAAGTATLTITTTASSTTQCASENRMQHGIPWYSGGGAVLACVLLFGIPARRRSWLNMLGITLLLVALAGGVMACGSGGGGQTCNPTTIPGTAAGNYTITVTGTSGSTTATGTVALTVQ